MYGRGHYVKIEGFEIISYTEPAPTYIKGNYIHSDGDDSYCEVYNSGNTLIKFKSK